MSSEPADHLPSIPSEMPAIAIRNAVVFPIPTLRLPLSVGRGRTLRAIERAADENGMLMVITQRDPDIEAPLPDDLFRVGTIARVLRLSRTADEHELVIEGVCRGRIDQFVGLDDHLRVAVTPTFDHNDVGPECDALIVNIRELAAKVIRLSPYIPDEAITVIEEIGDPSHLCDLIASQLQLNNADKQSLLELSNVASRMRRVVDLLAHEVAVLELSSRIRSEVRDNMDRHQREAWLREQLKVIRRELGDDSENDVDELEARVEAAKMPEATQKAAKAEIKRMRSMNSQSAEYSVARTYMEWICSVPWGETTEDNLDVRAALDVLDSDHHGLASVKRRITEYLAVRKLKGDLQGPILCLAGPPGVGKTSLARSVARALGREFVRISLGGVHDEAEIRGHRRTYVGAMPGRIVKALKRSGTMNPVILLDEIDKLGKDQRGDPGSALLEVLDPEQNEAFADHYLDVPVDLSAAMFIATANRLDTIPPALRDRLEIIELAGYLEEEKTVIARSHLLPRQIAAHGLDDTEIEFDQDALHSVINDYTREAGVRGLDRNLASVLRSIARDVAMGDVAPPLCIDASRVRAALGPRKIFPEVGEASTNPGVAVGLAWTPVGGQILFIEATSMPGQGKLMLTGQLGEVMRESAHAAMSYLRGRSDRLGIDANAFTTQDFHLHLPSGAIPKDGPSAGVTILAALASLLTDRPLKDRLAMTGELTLRGVVLPVGGVKEKVIAAARAGITTVVLPHLNRGDLEEIPPQLRERMTFHLVSRLDEVVEHALGIIPSLPLLDPAEPTSPGIAHQAAVACAPTKG